MRKSIIYAKNNSISFIFLAAVYSKYYTNSDYALNVLRKPRSINDMVIKIELRIFGVYAYYAKKIRKTTYVLKNVLTKN